MLVNGQKILDLECRGRLDMNDFYVYADFVKPGLHMYSVKQPDEYDTYRNQVQPGAQQEEDGILAFATANQQVLVSNWNTG